MDDKIIYSCMAIVFLVLQFYFRTDIRKIIDALTRKIDASVKEFDDHINEATEMHAMISSLEKAHNVIDSEGRPLWYMPPSVISTQKEMVQIMSVLAETQKAQIKILERLERKIDKE